MESVNDFYETIDDPSILNMIEDDTTLFNAYLNYGTMFVFDNNILFDKDNYNVVLQKLKLSLSLRILNNEVSLQMYDYDNHNILNKITIKTSLYYSNSKFSQNNVMIIFRYSYKKDNGKSSSGTRVGVKFQHTISEHECITPFTKQMYELDSKSHFKQIEDDIVIHDENILEIRYKYNDLYERHNDTKLTKTMFTDIYNDFNITSSHGLGIFIEKKNVILSNSGFGEGTRGHPKDDYKPVLIITYDDNLDDFILPNVNKSRYSYNNIKCPVKNALKFLIKYSKLKFKINFNNDKPINIQNNIINNQNKQGGSVFAGDQGSDEKKDDSSSEEDKKEKKKSIPTANRSVGNETKLSQKDERNIINEAVSFALKLQNKNNKKFCENNKIYADGRVRCCICNSYHPQKYLQYGHNVPHGEKGLAITPNTLLECCACNNSYDKKETFYTKCLGKYAQNHPNMKMLCLMLKTLNKDIPDKDKENIEEVYNTLDMSEWD